MKYLILGLALTLNGCALFQTNSMTEDLKAVKKMCSSSKVVEIKLLKEEYELYSKCAAEQFITIRPQQPKLYNQH